MEMENLYDIPEIKTGEEFFESVFKGQKVRIERIVSSGHVSPPGFWYDQNEDEWVCVLKGAARIRFEDSEIELNEGDHISISAHKKHRVEHTSSPCVWLAVFSS